MFSKLTIRNNDDNGMTNCQCLLGFDPLCDKRRDIAIEVGLYYVRDDKLEVETSGVDNLTSQIRKAKPMPLSSPIKNEVAKQNFGKPKAQKRLFLLPKFEENVSDSQKSQKYDFGGITTTAASEEGTVAKDQVRVEFDRSKEEPNSQN